MKSASLIFSWSCFNDLWKWNYRKQSRSLGADYNPSVSPASWTGFRLDLHGKVGQRWAWTMSHRCALNSCIRRLLAFPGQTLDQIRAVTTGGKNLKIYRTDETLHMHWLQTHKTLCISVQWSEFSKICQRTRTRPHETTKNLLRNIRQQQPLENSQ